MLLLERIGIFTVESYWSKWRLAVVIIMVIAMILTPSPDPYSMLLMGVPLVGLYFGGIWLCKIAPGRRLDRRAICWPGGKSSCAFRMRTRRRTQALTAVVVLQRNC